MPTPRQRLTEKQRISRALAGRSERVSKTLSRNALPREPWEQQPGETPKAYAQFVAYRDMEPFSRSFKLAAQKFNLPTSSASLLASNNDWVARATAWDMYLDRARSAQNEMNQLEMAARHAEIAKLMLGKIKDRLTTINFRALEPKVVSQWLEIAVKVERLSRGLTAESIVNNVQNISVNLRQMSEEDLLREIERETKRLSPGRPPAIDIPVSESSIESQSDAG